MRSSCHAFHGDRSRSSSCYRGLDERPIAHKGIPSGWTGESFGGRALYDFTIEQDAGRRVLHLASRNEHSTISRDITGKVNLQETPILEWTWKATGLPTGGD